MALVSPRMTELMALNFVLNIVENVIAADDYGKNDLSQQVCLVYDNVLKIMLQSQEEMNFIKMLISHRGICHRYLMPNPKPSINRNKIVLRMRSRRWKLVN